MLKGKRFKIAAKVLKEETKVCDEMLNEVHERQKRIHKIMFHNGFISEEDYERAKKEYVF
jgi:membrane peptidoglycan carboxypeptidase